MSVIKLTQCDRCGVALDRPHIQLIVTYHHPSTLDICKDCEAEFTFWVGKHPLWQTTVEQLLAGGSYTGGGYPTKEQLEEWRTR